MIAHPAFKDRPNHGQFAKDGRWETAWEFAAAATPSFEEVRTYLDGATEIAFEAFFGAAFFGVRLRGTRDETARRAFECVTALRDAADGAGFFADLARRLHLNALGHDISFAEVGAVNAWRSVGPFRIERLSDLSERFDALWRSLCASPVAQDVSHRKAIEFAQNVPVPHWFALPVSAPTAPFHLEPDALRQAASHVP